MCSCLQMLQCFGDPGLQPVIMNLMCENCLIILSILVRSLSLIPTYLLLRLLSAYMYYMYFSA